MKPLILKAFQLVGTVLSWWVSELQASLQELLSRIAPNWRRTLTAYVSRSRILIVEEGTNEPTPVLDLPQTPATGELTASLPQDQPLASAEPGRRVRVALDPEFAFVRSLRMPLAALPHLQSAIALQLPKLLPLSAALVRTDFWVHAPKANDISIDVELAAVKRSDIEPIERALQSWGLRPTVVQLGRSTDPDSRFRFSTSDGQVNRFTLSRTDFILGASAAALVLMAITVYGAQSFRAQTALDRVLLQANDSAAAVLQQRQRLISRLETLSILSEVERAPSAAAVLADVTTHMGHDGWVSTFELKGHDLRLVGQSTDPSALVKQLTSSALLSDVELKSSLSAGGGKERFEVTAHIKAGV